MNSFQNILSLAVVDLGPLPKYNSLQSTSQILHVVKNDQKLNLMIVTQHPHYIPQSN